MKRFSLVIVTVILCMAAGAVMICASALPSSGRQNAKALFVMEEDYRREISGKEKIPFDSEAVLFEGIAAPCDAENETFYIPQVYGSEEPDGMITASDPDARICILDEKGENGGGKKENIEKGRSFKAAVIKKNTYMEASVVFTGLPAVSICYEDGEIKGKEKHEGVICVFDPLRNRTSRMDCSFHVRGNTSVLFDKKSYRIELHDRTGKNLKESLLGLRRDDDWVLNSLSTDCTLSREKTAYSLWETVNAMEETPVPAPSVEYAEVFLNNRYMGVYGLMFPVDRKLMNLQPGDLLYKIRTWKEEMTAKGELTDYNGQNEILNENGFAYASIEYPGNDSGPYIWDPLKVYQDFVFETQDPDTLRGQNVSVDRENFVLHELFCEMTRAADNTWKNLFLAARRKKEGGYVLTETVWDLNYTFGDVFTWDPENGNTVFDRNGTDSYKLRYDRDYGYTALAKADPSYRDDAAAKWIKWRDSGISPDLVSGMLEDNIRILVRSGAFKRDCERWNREAPSDSYKEETALWIKKRFQFLDKMYSYLE